MKSAELYGKSPYGAHLKAVAEGRVKYSGCVVEKLIDIPIRFVYN